MTAITLNLLAEEQLALERRARDPFKMAIALGVFLSAAVVGLGAFTGMLASKTKSDMDALQAQFDAMNESAIAEQEIRYRFTEGLSKDILTLNKTRAIMAPQLATVKDLIPPNIQLTSLRFALSMESGQLLPPSPTSENATTKPVRPKKTERLVLRLDGKAISPRPELEVDEFLKALRADPVLSVQVEEIQLLSIARASQGPAGAELPGVFFVIECRYKETSR